MRGEKKLILKKITIQRFTVPLGRDEQKQIKGGDEDNPRLTAVPIFCVLPV